MGIFEKFRKNKKEVTPGGSPIYRYEEQENREFQMPAEMGRYAGEIEAQFAQLFPDHKSFVFHELLSDLVHIDVHVICPDEELPFYVLYTTGMSDLPMTLPEEIEEPELYRRSELYLFLPGDWQLGKPGDVGTDIPPEYYWPIHLIKFLARFPHEYKTWLGWGHTMPNGPGYAPIGEGTEMGGVVLTAMDKVPRSRPRTAPLSTSTWSSPPTRRRSSISSATAWRSWRSGLWRARYPWSGTSGAPTSAPTSPRCLTACNYPRKYSHLY